MRREAVQRLSAGSSVLGQVLGKGNTEKKQRRGGNGEEGATMLSERKTASEGRNRYQLGQRLLVCQVRGEMRSYCWV